MKKSFYCLYLSIEFLSSVFIIIYFNHHGNKTSVFITNLILSVTDICVCREQIFPSNKIYLNQTAGPSRFLSLYPCTNFEVSFYLQYTPYTQLDRYSKAQHNLFAQVLT